MCSKEEWRETAERRLLQVMALKSFLIMIETALEEGDLERIQVCVDASKDV